MESDIPYNFSWFVEDKVAGMGWPDHETLEYLAQSGIKTLVNLTHTRSYYEMMANQLGITCYNVPIGDCCPPTIEQIEKVLQFITETTSGEEDGAIGIHCLMGRGRTGTMLACYLVAAEGYTADNAIKETRTRRQYSIETLRQERAVKDFEKHFRQIATKK